MQGSRGLSLAAGLMVISSTTTDAAPPPRCGVWWDSSWCPDLRTKDDAPRVWSTFTASHLMFGHPPQPGTDIKENPEAMTLAQWAASDWEGCSNDDLAALALFCRLGVLVTIAPMLREPTASALDPADFPSLAVSCFNDGARRAKSMKVIASGSPDAPTVDIDDGGFSHRLWLTATGDLNGDGWQDWLINLSGRVHGGTMTISNTLLFTRRGDGPLVDITNQLPHPKTGPTGLTAWQAARTAQPAWPEGKPRAFAGSITVDGKRLGITMTLTCSNTLLSGTYRYNHVGKDIPLAGSVGADGSLSLHEFPGPGVGKAQFNLSRTDAGAWTGSWDNFFLGDMVAEGPLRHGTVTLTLKQ